MTQRLSTITLLLLITFTNVIAQKEISKSDVEELRIELSDSLRILDEDISQLKVDFNDQKKSLENKLNDASNIIEYLSSLVDSFGSVFIVLTIFIAILALALPILTYQFGIKPSRQALEELESKMDNRLAEYLKGARNKQIEIALNNIRNGNTDLQHQGLSYIVFTQHEGFSDNQMFQIYSILQKSKSEMAIKNQLAFVLSTRRNDYATELFNSRDIIDDPFIKQMAYSYYAKIGLKDNYKGIKNILQAVENQYSDFISLVSSIQQYSSDEVVELFNDSTIVDLLTESTLAKMNSDLPSILESRNISMKDFEASYLAERIGKAQLRTDK